MAMPTPNRTTLPASFAAPMPPHSQHAEMALLGSVIAYPDVWPMVAELVAPEDFYDTRHQAIWRACLDVAADHAVTDTVTVMARLDTGQRLAAAGGPGYIKQLVNAAPPGAFAEDYAREVLSASEKRRVLLRLQNMARMAHDDTPLADIVEAAQQIVAATRTGIERPATAREVAKAVWDQVCHWADNPTPIRGLPTGLAPLDQVICGLARKNLTILFARPGHGKSALAFQIARHNAHLGRRVLLFSLEMSAEAVLLRLACADAGLDSQAVKRGELADEDRARLARALGRIADEPLVIATPTAPTTGAILAETIRQRPALVVVDHAGLIEDRIPGYANKDLRVEQLFQELRGVAIRADCHLIAISQARKSIDERSDKHPLLGDIPYGGERHADLILGMLRPCLYDQDEPEIVAHIDVLKHRDGPAGARIELAYHAAHTRFARLEHIVEGLND